ncbi:hypothetical protein D0504_08175 [Weissella confusa]|uniref:hypothetical protein n=1 Tax=Weissella confusa TaxID=1583 RepID=UPI0021C1E584|nr:hypothetical protein [Weissella confusa]MCT8393686.1 hypothetical protein [Weissella confusa]
MTSIDQIKNNINNASIFDLPQALIDAELYDEEDAHKVVEQVYADFEKGGNVLDSIVKPTFFSIFDGLLQLKAFKSIRDRGMTASDLLGTAWEFKYSAEDKVDYERSRPKYSDRYKEQQIIQAQKNIHDSEKLHPNTTVRRVKRETNSYKEFRKEFEDTGAMNDYKRNYFGDNKLAADEYDSHQRVYSKQNNKPSNYTAESKKQAETDHIEPIRVITNELESNYGLSKDDIKTIINDESNFAITSEKTNRGHGGKSDYTNKQYVDKNSDTLSETQKETMIRKQDEAKTARDHNVNKALRHNMNLLNKDTRDMQKQIAKNAGMDGVGQAGNKGLVEAIRLLLNPLTYEIKDMIKNGIDVDGYKKGAAVKYRFKRMTRYILRQLKNIKDIVFDLVKTIITGFIDGILSLFVGIFEKIYKIVKQTIGAAIQAFKILFGKDSKNMSTAQKGDAILKLVGSTVIVLSGSLIDELLKKLVPNEFIRGALSTIATGVAAALFMYAMDRLDIFGVKYEQRTERIKEIFDARIADIKAAQEAMDDATVEKLAEAKKKFFEITENAKTAIQNNDWLTVNNEIVAFATSAGFEPKFESDEDFTSWLDSDDSDTI